MFPSGTGPHNNNVKLCPALPIAACAAAASLLCTGCVKYRARPLSAPVVEGQYRARSVNNEAIQEFAQSAGWKQWPPAVLDLNALALIAGYYSPDLDMARSQIKIADAAVRTAGARINPSLSADGGYSRQPEAHTVYAISPDFTIETAGKRGYRILQAQEDAMPRGFLSTRPNGSFGIGYARHWPITSWPREESTYSSAKPVSALKFPKCWKRGSA